MWSILENVPCALEKNVYSAAFGWNVLKISTKSIGSNMSLKSPVYSLIFYFYLFIFILTWRFFIAFRERGSGEEKRETDCFERETSIGCLLVRTLTRDQTCNLGMCPNWELNLLPFCLWDDAPNNWATPAWAPYWFSVLTIHPLVSMGCESPLLWLYYC